VQVTRNTLAEQIKDVLLERIIKGHYKPSDRLTEMAIAKELGSSQTPVREALQMLEAMRLVESEPHRGTRVREITDLELSEARIVRGALEETAARMAVDALKAHIPALRAEQREMQEAIERKDFDEFAKRAGNFHRMIVYACGNSVLVQSWEALAFDVKIRMLSHKFAYSALLQGVRGYLPIIDAFERGDGMTAGRLLRENGEGISRIQATITNRITADEFKNAQAARREREHEDKEK